MSEGRKPKEGRKAGRVVQDTGKAYTQWWSSKQPEDGPQNTSLTSCPAANSNEYEMILWMWYVSSYLLYIPRVSKNTAKWCIPHVLLKGFSHPKYFINQWRIECIVLYFIIQWCLPIASTVFLYLSSPFHHLTRFEVSKKEVSLSKLSWKRTGTVSWIIAVFRAISCHGNKRAQSHGS